MAFKFHCIHCGQRIAAEDSSRGTTANCPSCANVIDIPSPSPLADRRESPATAAPPIPLNHKKIPLAQVFLPLVGGGVLIIIISAFLNSSNPPAPVITQFNPKPTTTPSRYSDKTSLPAQSGSVTVSGYLASPSEELLDKAVSYAVAHDNAALEKLIQSGLVFSLKGGISVQIMDTRFFQGKIKIRPLGDTIEVWTVIEAVH